MNLKRKDARLPALGVMLGKVGNFILGIYENFPNKVFPGFILETLLKRKKERGPQSGKTIKHQHLVFFSLGETSAS